VLAHTRRQGRAPPDRTAAQEGATGGASLRRHTAAATALLFTMC
jgi:hypothetical protein